MKNIFKFFILGIFINLNLMLNVFAFSTSVSSPKFIEEGETFNVTLNFIGVSDMTAFDCLYSYDTNKLELVSTSSGSGWQTSVGSKVAGFYLAGANGNVSPITFTFRAKTSFVSGESTIIGFSNVKGSNSNVEKLTGNDTSVSIGVVNNYLGSLSISGASINFNKDVLNYEVTIDNNTAVIGATPQVGSSTVSGTGTKTLNYGTNTFYVTVTSAKGTNRTYTIKVNKPDNRNANNSLKSLTVSNTNIHLSNATSYTDMVEYNVSSVTISASASDSKATVTGTGTFNLDVGTNRYNVVVTAENGTQKIYSISIVRRNEKKTVKQDDKKNNTDKNIENTKPDIVSLSISNENVPIDDETNYVVKVNSDVKEAVFNYKTSDEKATVTIDGDNILSDGENVFYLTVTSSSGETKEYKVTVVRSDENDDEEKKNVTTSDDAKKDETPKKNTMMYIFLGTLAFSVLLVGITFIYYFKK